MKKLKEKWGITSNFQLFIICVVFAITGSFSAFITEPVILFLFGDLDGVSPFLSWPLRIFIIFPIYQVLLLFFGFIFFQYKFFYQFEKKFLNEIEQFKHLTKGRSKGFRAPTFSLTETSSWVIDMLQENGYVYDSSVVPAKTQMYGFPNAETKPYKISSKSLEKNDESSNLIEFPLLVTKFFGKKIPAAGGFYLRTLPFNVIKKAIKDYEKKSIPASFYIHSW